MSIVPGDLITDGAVYQLPTGAIDHEVTMWMKTETNWCQEKQS